MRRSCSRRSRCARPVRGRARSANARRRGSASRTGPTSRGATRRWRRGLGSAGDRDASRGARTRRTVPAGFRESTRRPYLAPLLRVQLFLEIEQPTLELIELVERELLRAARRQAERRPPRRQRLVGRGLGLHHGRQHRAGGSDDAGVRQCFLDELRGGALPRREPLFPCVPDHGFTSWPSANRRRYTAVVKSAAVSSCLLSARATSPKHSNMKSVVRLPTTGVPVEGVRVTWVRTRSTGEKSTYGTVRRSPP